MSESYDPDVHGSYGEWLRSKNIQTRPSGWSNATRDQVLVDTPSEKRVLDQLGNEVRQYGSDQQDVTVRPRIVKGRLGGSPPANNDAQGG